MILGDQIKVQLTLSFKKVVKKLNKNQKQDLDAAVRELVKDPLIGASKKGDLSYLRVHKFKMNKQLCLIGYSYDDGALVLQLIAMGTHENFYRNLKR